MIKVTLHEVLDAFVTHRREVVTRRTIFELGKARDRAHVLEGQAVALANIDEVIELIKSSPSPAEARVRLTARDWSPGQVTEMLQRAGSIDTRPDALDESFGMRGGDSAVYRLSEVQAQAILDLRLHRLTGLEQEKILKEYEEILVKIQELSHILADPDRLLEVIREELAEVREQYADDRRTEIVADHSDLSIEDLIPEEDVVVTLSHAGYAKAQTLDTYQAQRRGGRGRSATRMKDEDFIENLFVANTHDTLLCFSSHGKVYWLKVYQLPLAGRGSRGKPIVNLLPLEGDERISAVVPTRDFPSDRYVFFATERGTVKKTALEAYSRPRANGIIAIDIRDGDGLVDVEIVSDNEEIMLFADSGKAIRFRGEDVREMGRTAGGVRGIRVTDDQSVIAMVVVRDGEILVATENGFGKRTSVEEFSTQGRGGQGLIAIQTTERNGRCIGALQVGDDDEVMLISHHGTLVRTPVAEISTLGRNTQGVRLIRLDEGDSLSGLARIEAIEGEDE